jgi:RNA polymerase sigma factor (sigma-70 family)
LTVAEENRLFRQLRELRQSQKSTLTPRDRRRAESLRNQIVVANLRLLVSIAARFTAADRTLGEAVSDGVAPLIRAAELFDASRGNRFSTYASHAIWNHLARIRKRESARRGREPVSSPTVLAEVAGSQPFSQTDTSRRELLARRPEELLRPVLSERETLMIAARFGLGDFHREHKFREVAEMVGLSRERVRVLTRRALQKLREHLQIDLR